MSRTVGVANSLLAIMALASVQYALYKKAAQD
jgi:hypothetical protein